MKSVMKLNFVIWNWCDPKSETISLICQINWGPVQILLWIIWHPHQN